MRSTQIKNLNLLNLFLGLIFTCVTGSVVNAQYCLPTYNNSSCPSGDFVDDVQFVTINQIGTGCSITSANYSNYSATISTTVIQSSTHQITVKPGSSWGQYFVVFIDLNQDQDFADAGEFFDIGYAGAGQTISSMINIPANATIGSTRLRVMCRFGSTALTHADSCATSLSYGEVEDYGLNINPIPPVDMAVVSLDSPISGCGMTSETVTVQIANYGLDSVIGPTVCYSLDGQPPVCQTYTDTVDSGDSITIDFAAPADVTAPGPHSFSAWVTASGDANSINDTLFDQAILNYGLLVSPPYIEDFESSNGNWEFVGDTNLTQWEWGSPTATFIPAAASGTNAWVTNLNGTYLSQANEVTYLRSPCFDLSGSTADPFIAFSHLYNTETCCDEGWLEMSTDAGNTWSKVVASGASRNWYNDLFNEWWDGNSGQPGVWRTANNRLTGSAGNSEVLLRFAFSSNSGVVVAEGFGIDNFLLSDTIINVGVVAVNSPQNGCLLSSSDTVSIDIINEGSHTLFNPQVCYTVNGGIPVCEMINDSIPPDSIYTYVFSTTVDLSATGSYDFQAYTVVSEDLFSENDTSLATIINFPLISTFPYVEDFETVNGLWVSGGIANDWELGTPFKLNIQGAASGSKAWVTGTTGFVNYENDADSYVEGPCFDLSAISNPWVGLNIWWETQPGADGAVLEYSLDGGVTWTEVGNFNDPFNWYNDPDVSALNSAGWSGRSGGNGGSEGYVFAKHNLDNISAQSSVRFRIHFMSNSSFQYDGIAFDDFSIATTPAVDLGNDTIVCEDVTLSPDLPLNGTFAWDSLSGPFGVAWDSVQTVTMAGTGNYVLTYTDSLGFCGMDTIFIAINATPKVDLGSYLNICIGTSATLGVDSLVYPNVLWSNTDTTPSINVNTATTVSVAVTDTNGCNSADTISTFIVPLPQFSLGPDTTACQGGSSCFSTGLTDPSYSHIWSTGAITETVCPLVVSNLWAIATDSNGCQWADSILLSPGPAIPNSDAGFDTTNCPVIDFSDLSTGIVDTYFWDFGDGNTSTAPNPSNDYRPAGYGSYNVIHVASNSCGSDTTFLTVDIKCLININDGLDNRLFVYPNPNQGRFRVMTELTGTVPVAWQITDLQGRVIKERDFGSRSGGFSEEIELEIVSGIYFLKFTAGDKTQIEKIVVE